MPQKAISEATPFEGTEIASDVSVFLTSCHFRYWSRSWPANYRQIGSCIVIVEALCMELLLPTAVYNATDKIIFA